MFFLRAKFHFFLQFGSEIMRRIELNREMFSYDAILTFKKFQKYYSGEYKVTVSNEEGTTTTKFSLEVKKNDLSKSLPIPSKDASIQEEKIEELKPKSRRSYPLKPKIRSNSHKNRQLKMPSDSKQRLSKLDLTDLSSDKSNSEKALEDRHKKQSDKNLDESTTVSMFSDCETVGTEDCSFLNSFNGSIPGNFSPRSTSTKLPTRCSSRNDMQDNDTVFETMDTIEPKTSVSTDKTPVETDLPKTSSYTDKIPCTTQKDAPKIVIDDCNSASTRQNKNLSTDGFKTSGNTDKIPSQTNAPKIVIDDCASTSTHQSDISPADDCISASAHRDDTLPTHLSDTSPAGSNDTSVFSDCDTIATKDISFLDGTFDASIDNESSKQVSILLSSSSSDISTSSCTTLVADMSISSSDESNGAIDLAPKISKGKKEKSFNDKLAEKVFGTVGEKLVLRPCLKHKKPEKCTWKKDGVEVQNLSGNIQLSNQTNENFYLLTINYFKTEHTGKYVFVAESDKTVFLQHTFDVRIKTFKSSKKGKKKPI